MPLFSSFITIYTVVVYGTPSIRYGKRRFFFWFPSNFLQPWRAGLSIDSAVRSLLFLSPSETLCAALSRPSVPLCTRSVYPRGKKRAEWKKHPPIERIGKRRRLIHIYFAMTTSRPKNRSFAQITLEANPFKVERLYVDIDTHRISLYCIRGWRGEPWNVMRNDHLQQQKQPASQISAPAR